MPYSKDKYWESHTTMGGKKDMYSEGSVADRGGNYESMGYTSAKMPKGKKKKSINGYGFGGNGGMKGEYATIASKYGKGKMSGGNPGHMSY